MAIDDELGVYLDRLAGVLGHADRRTGLMDYCRGLMLPIKRKSIEPMAAHADPLHVHSCGRILLLVVSSTLTANTGGILWIGSLISRSIR